MSDFTSTGILEDAVERIQTAIDFLESEDIKRTLIRRDKCSYGSLVTDLIHVKCSVRAVAAFMKRQEGDKI